MIQTLHRIKADGVLRLASPDGTCEVVFASGDIVGVESSFADGRNEVARRLRALGRLPPGDDTPTRAVISGAITQQEVDEIAAKVAVEELYDLTTWQHADFVFHESAEGGETAALVERHRARPLTVTVDALLLEAARRQDEWQLLREAFRGDEVIRVVPGREAELELHAGEEVAQLVLPRIDGVRAVDDLLRDSTVTRFELYQLLAGLQDRGLVAVAEPDEIAAHAAQRAAGGDHAGAALLWRRLLAQRPEDAAVAASLAASLEQSPDMPGAAGCWAQLALAQLAAGRPEEALSAAQQAVALAPHDPEWRLVVVRCLVAARRDADAVDALRGLGRQYVELGRIEDARDTCLKVLQMRPDDEEARRELVRIHALSAPDPGSEDVVVCAQCSAVNPREATTCTKCAARLHLACLSCGRVVSVSDRICVFCGAEPHAPPKGGTSRARALALQGPSTDRIIDPRRARGELKEKGSEQWRKEAGRLLRSAREHETAKRYEEALGDWKALSRLQSTNVELTAHIRELETLCHDRFIERQIELGHDLRRRRRYWRALRAYRSAQRGLSAADPRLTRLVEIVGGTARSHRRVMVIYGAALAVLAGAAAIAAKPYVVARAHQRDCAAFADRVAGAATLSELGAARDELGTLGGRLVGLPGALRQRALEQQAQAEGALLAAQLAASQRQFAAIEAALARGDAGAAAAALAEHRAVLGDSPRLAGLVERQKALATQLGEREVAVRQAPAELAAAAADEAEGRLGAALARYRVLAKLPPGPHSGPATEGVARLQPGATAFAAAVAEARAACAEDLAKGAARLTALAADAARWGESAALAAARDQAAARIAVAERAYQALAPDAGEAALEAFIAEHAASPAATSARARLAQLRTAVRTRDAALAQYRALMEAKEWERAHAAGTTLARNHAAVLKPGDVLLPLVVESQPAGAAVAVDGAPAGTAPLVLRLDPLAPPRTITVALAGYRPLRAAAADLLAGHRWQPALDREALWTASLGKPALGLAPLRDGGCVAATADGLVRLQPDGRSRWTLALDRGDAPAGVLPPRELADGTLVAPTPRGLAIVGRDGALRREIAAEGAVRPWPAAYANDLFGGRRRLAFAADALHVGDLDGTLAPLALPAPALSGPLALAHGVDRMLVIADLCGRLVAIEESTLRPLWNADLRASEVGALVPVAEGVVATLLDGSRIACWSVSGSGAQQRWSRELGAPATGDPVHAGDAIAIAAGTRLLRLQPDGQPLASVDLPSPASAPAAAERDLVAVGCRGHLVLTAGGSLRWSTPVPAPVAAVAFAGGRVVAGLADGTVAAFAP